MACKTGKDSFTLTVVFQAKPVLKAVVQAVDDTLRFLHSQVVWQSGSNTGVFCRRLIFHL